MAPNAATAWTEILTDSDRPELVEDIKRRYNVVEVDIDEQGDVYLGAPLQRWLSPAELTDLARYLRTLGPDQEDPFVRIDE